MCINFSKITCQLKKFVELPLLHKYNLVSNKKFRKHKNVFLFTYTLPTLTKYSIVFLCILNPFFLTRAHTISFMDKLKKTIN